MEWIKDLGGYAPLILTVVASVFMYWVCKTLQKLTDLITDSVDLCVDLIEGLNLTVDSTKEDLDEIGKLVKKTENGWVIDDFNGWKVTLEEDEPDIVDFLKQKLNSNGESNG